MLPRLNVELYPLGEADLKPRPDARLAKHFAPIDRHDNMIAVKSFLEIKRQRNQMGRLPDQESTPCKWVRAMWLRKEALQSARTQLLRSGGTQLLIFLFGNHIKFRDLRQ
jgi:hypothetical protein